MSPAIFSMETFPCGEARLHTKLDPQGGVEQKNYWTLVNTSFFFIMSCWMVQKSGRYEVNITIIYRVSYIQTVVVWDLNHQQYVHQQSGFTNF